MKKIPMKAKQSIESEPSVVVGTGGVRRVTGAPTTTDGIREPGNLSTIFGHWQAVINVPCHCPPGPLWVG